MIAENLQILRNRIEEICEKVNRDPKSVKLIAVSKGFSIDEIKQAIHADQIEFGENKAQELVAKFEVFGNQVIWHFIGHLQRNKVKYAVRTADYIHSVDSLSLAEEIQKRAENLGKTKKILIEVKTSEEETKSGVTEKEEIKRIARYCSQASNLSLIGLMTIAPLTEDKNLIRKSFSYLRKLKEELNTEGYELKELSMGMTSDYEIAIEEGATMLRIGSAIFGERIYYKED
ncbi:MAG: YggS family pyridoxal phosphate enzyme [Ignavibacteria bacterium RIFOXYB2_FULL_35_12]|nr:MAG: YggS family pyridoxal phosphate enzyme [Ignavibacteria bacterium GWA2_36_19]OGU49233.1 MAG: YggS family pyridoxal phosphate enzyme [Ignavibacteria bacterium GWC2_35_8]OGU60397.1 MAG: YggS family pyridoxal phosphate enzyme [Ignavibacteria bacterium GWF2_35_20]OGU82300.1 MAG: YggS family pyridoxal phosphate enzyme [Ignavibacteria bacterium RBG_16_35_7]OGU84306.1 MAG: YggS family pyridoxal phosphate enzyme [Ignavibacteria bacterium RIFOXYA12_FULL_35_25]OGU88563.1 MAG: YggS family pyridoxa